MLWNYIKITLRNFFRDKGYSLINISGLALGMACCLVMLLYMHHELTYDTFHADADHIYRIAEQTQRPDGFTRRRATTGTPLAPLVQKNLPGVRATVRISPWEGVVNADNSSFREERFFFADSTIFDVFTLLFIAGNPRRALAGPNKVVLTEETARKYYGDADPVGQKLTFDHTMELTVTGVLRTLPSISHLQFDFLGSFETLERTYRGWTEHWDAPVFTYILLDDKTDPASVETRFPSFITEFRDLSDGTELSYWLQPLTDIHLSWDTSNFTVVVFPALAVLILLLAAVNYINLSTARASRRAREVGIRKAAGAQRRQLFGQFVGESVLTSFLALPPAIALAEMFLPTVNALAGTKLTIDYLGNLYVLPGLISITLLIGLLAGAYPALVLSSFRPTTIIQGGVSGGRSIRRFRSGLVVFQFAAAIMLIIAAVVTHNQLTYLLTKDLGFDKEEVLIMRLDDQTAKQNYASLKHELSLQPGVLAVTAASDIPGGVDCRGLTYQAAGTIDLVSIPTAWVDYGYLKTLGIELEAGRDFTTDIAADAGNSFIINHTGAEYLGLKDAVGHRLTAAPDAGGIDQPWHDGPIVGITTDFHFRYLYCRLQPLVMIVDPQRCGFLLVRINPDHLRETMSALEKTWHDIVPDLPAEFTFLDDELHSLYQSEERFAAIVRLAGLLAVVVASLGLIGLAAYVVETRTREIGIRKVLGASVSSILLLLSRTFLLLLIIAVAVAWPVGYFLMRYWLQNFIYRVDIGPETFIISGVVALLLVVAAVGFQAIRAALTNPVDTLRHE